MNELLRDFLTESSEQLALVGAQLAQLESDRPNARIVANVSRLIRTLKGASGILNLPRLERIADDADALMSRLHDGATRDIDAAPLLMSTVDRIKSVIDILAQDRGAPGGEDDALLAALRKAASPDETRLPSPFEADFEKAEQTSERGADTTCISHDALDRLTALARDLVFTRNQLNEIVKGAADPAIAAPLHRVSGILDELRESVRAARALPAERLFAGYSVFAQDLASDLGKKVELVLDDGGAEVDRPLFNVVRESLLALIQNALTHGIESLDERLRLGKPEFGLIELSAVQKAGLVTLTVSDDGRGFNSQWLRQRLIAFGSKTSAEVEPLLNDELCRLLVATELCVSNRLLEKDLRPSGLDRAFAAMARIGGAVSLRSAPGEGSAFTLLIPSKLAIAPAVIVVAAGERMAVLRSAIVRSFEIGQADPTPGAEPMVVSTIETPEGVLPLARLDLLATGRAAAADPRIVLHIAARRVALAVLVDEIIGFQDVVLEPLPSPLRNLSLYSGVAALGDGSAVMVLDPAGLARALGVSASNAVRVGVAARPISQRVASSMVIFRAAGKSPRALPISSNLRVLRLTEAQSLQATQEGATAIEGRLTPMAWLSGEDAPRSANTVLLLQDGEDHIALAVEEVIDVIPEALTVEFANGRPGALGVGGVRGAATEILDPNFFLDRRKRRRLLDLSSKRKSILLIEPDAFFRNMMMHALIKRGFQVCALSGVLAAQGAAPPADLLVGALIDVDAAAADGGAWVRKLRAGFGEMHAPPLFGLASHAGPAMRRRASALSFTCVFGKFDRHGLFAALALAESMVAPEKAA